MNIDELLRKHHLFVMVGQGGSGKSEFSLWLASQFPAGGRFLDLDQTKAVFRSREYAKKMKAFTVQSGMDFLDSPTVPHGFRDLLVGEDTVIVDMPADQKGLLALGQVAETLAQENACLFLIFNPYRGFGEKARLLAMQLSAVRTHIPKIPVYIVANPTYGVKQTAADDVRQGRKIVEDALKSLGENLAFTLVDTRLGISGDGWIPMQVHFNEEV